jgi:cytochrome c-type biogenesis protein
LLASKNDKTKTYGKDVVAKKGRGLSKAEKVAIPIIIIIAIWAVYSALNPGPGGTSTLTNSATTSLSQSGLAPDFTLPIVGPNGLTGQMLTLSSFRGKVVLLEFMEPWCPHCQHMAPLLDGLYAKYGTGNVVFVSVSGPWNGATAADAAGFITQYGTSWNYVYDSSGTIFNNYGVSSTPTFVIVAPDGTVSNVLTGEQTSDALASAITAAGGT